MAACSLDNAPALLPHKQEAMDSKKYRVSNLDVGLMVLPRYLGHILISVSIFVWRVFHSRSLVVSSWSAADRDRYSILDRLANGVCNHFRNDRRNGSADLPILRISCTPEYKVIGKTLYTSKLANCESILSILWMLVS